jgi:MFS family permease
VFLANRVPPKVRDSYNKDVWAGILAAVMTGLTVPFVAIIAREQLKASVFEIGILTAAPTIGSTLSLYWAHIMNGRSTMTFGVWAWLISRSLLLMTLFAVTSWSFVTIITLYWVINAASGPAYSVLMKEIYPDNDRVRIMGYVRVCIVITSILMAAIAGPLLKIVSYRYIFTIAAVFGIISALWFGRISTSTVIKHTSDGFSHLLREAIGVLREDHAYRWYCAGIFIFGSACLFAAPIYSIYQVDVLHVDTRWASVYTVIAQIIAMVAYYYWGGYVDRKKPVVIVLVNSVVFLLIPINYIFAAKAWMLIPCCIVSGLANPGFELAYFNGILHYAPSDKVPLYQAIFASLIGIRGSIIPFLSASLVQGNVFSMQGIFLMTIVLMLIGLGVQTYGMRKYEMT